MIIQSLSRSINKGICLLPKLIVSDSNQSLINRKFHVITKNNLPKSTIPMHMENLSNNNSHVNNKNLLQSFSTPLWLHKCGLKYRRYLQLRCRDCFYFWVDGRKGVRCTTHPRHKQLVIAKKPKNTWILTSVCQKPKRPWA